MTWCSAFFGLLTIPLFWHVNVLLVIRPWLSPALHHPHTPALAITQLESIPAKDFLHHVRAMVWG